MSSAVPLAITNGKPLPVDLIENILSRLPVKSLKRFRAVEKLWRSLIDSEGLAKMHLRRSLQTNSNRYLISGVRGFYRLGLDSIDEVKSMELDFKYNDKGNFAVSNSIDGMFVVKRDHPESLILFNPFTREYKVLPDCPSEDTKPCIITYGFGYDSENEDYKVVKFMIKRNLFLSFYEEWIYGLKSDCWRRTKGTNYKMGEWPAHVNGVLHSMVRNSPADQLKLIGFDVETEEDYEVPLPRIESHALVACFLEVFDGCLAVVCNYESWFQIWVMEEYGVRDSWKVLQAFPCDPDYSVRPVFYSKEGETIVINITGQMLTVFSSRSDNVKKITTPFTFSPRLCIETLISPNCWSKTNDNSFTEKQNNKGKKEAMMMKKKKKKKKRDDFLSSGFKLVL